MLSFSLKYTLQKDRKPHLFLMSNSNKSEARFGIIAGCVIRTLCIKGEVIGGPGAATPA
jgi:hypothetical protein